MIVYLIQAHKDVNQLNKLISLLVSKNSKIFVHLDKKWDLDLSILNKAIYVVEPRIDVTWGDWSQVEASSISLKMIEKEVPNYNHVVFISGQDFPLYSNETIQQYLKPNTDYIHFQEISKTGWACESRFEAFHYHGHSLLLKFGYVILNKLGVKRKMPNNLKPFGGAGWWCLTQSTIKAILNYIEKNPQLISFFKTTQCPDELFFQTVICNSRLSSTLVNNHMRFIKFIEGKSNPEILTINDLDSLFLAKAIFARKMDTELSDELMQAIIQNRQLKSDMLQ